MLIFSDIQEYDLGFLAKILFVHGFLGQINYQDPGQKSKIIKILSRKSRLSQLFNFLVTKPKLSALGKI